MTKHILIIFGGISRVVFEFGVPVLGWMLWGWQIGIALSLWYILWTWMGFSLLKIFESEQIVREKSSGKGDEQVKAFFKKLHRLSQEVKEKDDQEKEIRKLLDIIDDKDKKN
jgi:hypothetical protein